MHEASKFVGSFMHNLILVITTIDMSYTSQNFSSHPNFFYSSIIINVLACLLPAYFHIHFHLEKEKERNSTSISYCPLSFLFCFEHYDILLDIYEENMNYHFISHLHIVIHQRLNHLLYALLIIIEVCNNLQSPC